ncbi:sodium-dependent transporter [Clostridiaceae bacterium]|nr:sodium-dependent transporter [Clostridiaceae bacterium]NBH81083.1 sodium-dependent transporter [Clostridiaceae bacterium]
MQNKHKNGSFGSRVGFVLACVGSAVGMGNIWLFPYRVGQYGGAAFLIPYFLFVCIFGLVGLSAEFAIGRRAGTGTLGAYRYCWNARGKGRLGSLIGWIPLLGSLGIAIGYSIIVGWVLRALWGAVTGQILIQDAGEFFAGATGPLGSVPWHTMAIVIAALLLMFGATKGIEKANKVLMPLFFILFAALAVRVALLPGASEGYRFLLIPKWESLLQVDTWVMAMGQAFFSLSITGSGMIVYGTYLSKKEDILHASVQTAVFDTIAALLAAFAIMPAVFAFGIAPSSGPPLLFITLPNVFRQIPFGRVFAAFFFLSVAFAGITSLINMFEAVCESWQTRFGLGRRPAVALCAGITLAVGLLIEEEPKMGAWMDVVSIYIIPFGALLGAISVYFVLGRREIGEELNLGRKTPLPGWFFPLARYVYVPLALIVFLLGIAYHGIG